VNRSLPGLWQVCPLPILRSATPYNVEISGGKHETLLPTPLLQLKTLHEEIQ